MPQKPYITDFEDYVLPDEQPDSDNALSLEELGNFFGAVNRRQSQAAADQIWAEQVFASQTESERAESDSPLPLEIVQTGSTTAVTADDDANGSGQGAFSEEPPQAAANSPSPDAREDGCPVIPESIFEALLFVGNEDNDSWVAADDVCRQIRNLTPEEVQDLSLRIQKRWRNDGRPYYLEQSGNKYRMALSPAFYPVRAQFYSTIREFQLSQNATNALSIVAYQQPISAADVEALTKEQNAQTQLNQLVRRGLLSVEKIGTGKKKINLYRTTPRFLEFAGLESLEDLPTMEDL